MRPFQLPFFFGFLPYFTTLWNNCDFSRLAKSESLAAKCMVSFP